MDFIKESLEKSIKEESIVLSENVEMLFLNISSQMKLAVSLLGVITNGKMLEKLGEQGTMLKKGASFNDFPISKAMMQSLAIEMLDSSKELMKLVLEELEDGRPDITEYNVDENRHKVSDMLDGITPHFEQLINSMQKKQLSLMEKSTANQRPN